MARLKIFHFIKEWFSRIKRNKHILNPLIFNRFLIQYFFYNNKLKKLLTPEIKKYFQNNPENHWDISKYLHTEEWVFENLARLYKIGLQKTTGLKVLDLSTGYGYFPYLCNALGHKAEGTDLTHSQHNLYEKITRKLKVNVQPLKIEKFKSFNFNQKYDIITSFMICFNQHKNPELWHIDEWEFFLKNVNEFLNENGFLVLSFNAESIKEPIDIDLLNYFSDKGAKVEKTLVTFSKSSLI